MWLLLVLSGSLWVAAGLGLLVVWIEHVSVWRHLREPVRRPSGTPGISILKPLCGVDDQLAENLEIASSLDYPNYELLLGVKNEADAAYPLALEIAKRWPERVRLVIQRGEPGRNAKVNQLMTLAQEARHDILVVSDSNVQLPKGYLQEIAAQLEDPGVALVTHPIVGAGERRLGSLMDRLHLASLVTPGMIAPKRILGVALVVGKSMSMRRADLVALGGFERFKDLLAEDYLMGRAIGRELHREIRVAHEPITNISHNVTVEEFFQRYVRWDVIQRKLVGRLVYSCQIFLNPGVLGLLALLVYPSWVGLWLLAALWAGKSLGDGVSRSLQERSRLRLRDLAVTPLKDLVVGAAYFQALVGDTVIWRGQQLKVLRGTRLGHPPRPEEEVAAAAVVEGRVPPSASKVV